MSGEDVLVEIKNVSKTYKTSSGKSFLAIQECSFDIYEHEFVSIIGHSGCGKSTLLRMVAGLETYDTGQILLRGEEITGPSSERGMVFQEYALFPWRSVKDNILFGPELRNASEEEKAEILKKYLNIIGLEKFENALPSELSGGMKQRVAIASVLANSPQIVLMDEPFGALDAQTRLSMQVELGKIWQETKKSVLFVTHAVDEAVYLSRRVVLMSNRPGRIKEIIDVNLPYPRDFGSDEFNAYRKLLLDKIMVGN